MKLPKAAHEHLRKEFAIAAKFMQNTSDQSGVLYYFSAFLGATHRAMNLSYSTDLALMHLVLKTTHGELAERIRGDCLLQARCRDRIGAWLFLVLSLCWRTYAKSCRYFRHSVLSGNTIWSARWK